MPTKGNFHLLSSGDACMTQSTLNIDLILWHTQLNLSAKMLNHGLNPFFFTLQAYILPHTLSCMFVSIFEF